MEIESSEQYASSLIITSKVNNLIIINFFPVQRAMLHLIRLHALLAKTNMATRQQYHIPNLILQETASPIRTYEYIMHKDYEASGEYDYGSWCQHVMYNAWF
jgi:hypothetical protein